MSSVFDNGRLPYAQAKEIAEDIKAKLAPHCHRIEIAGSVRRKKSHCKDIEIVAIPKPYDVGLFASGIATVVERWVKVKGELPGCKYTQRLVPYGEDLCIALDLFFVTPDNWGYQYAIRTGSADYSRFVLARGWVKAGYRGDEGMLWRYGGAVPCREEEDLFKMAGVAWVPPEERELKP